MDPWESDQNQWTATLPVLEHFQSSVNSQSAAVTDEAADNRNDVAVKKRKIDANNKNYVIAGMHHRSLDIYNIRTSCATPTKLPAAYLWEGHDIICGTAWV